jgi:hypothetical protein
VYLLETSTKSEEKVSALVSKEIAKGIDPDKDKKIEVLDKKDIQAIANLTGANEKDLVDQASVVLNELKNQAAAEGGKCSDELTAKINLLRQYEIADEDHAKNQAELQEIVNLAVSAPFKLLEMMYGYGSTACNAVSYMLTPVNWAVNHSYLVAFFGLYQLNFMSPFQIIKLILTMAKYALTATKYTLQASAFIVTQMRFLYSWIDQFKDFLTPIAVVGTGISVASLLCGIYWYWLQSYEKQAYYHVEDVISITSDLKKYPQDATLAGKLAGEIYNLSRLADIFFKENRFELAEQCFKVIDIGKKYLNFAH